MMATVQKLKTNLGDTSVSHKIFLLFEKTLAIGPAECEVDLARSDLSRTFNARNFFFLVVIVYPNQNCTLKQT